MDVETLDSILFVVRAGGVVVALWVCSRAFDLWQNWDRTRQDEAAFVRAIYAEIAFNTFDMRRFLRSAVSVNVLEELFEVEGFIPHITDARHTDVFRSRINQLHVLARKSPDDVDLVADVVRFYGELEKITQQIEGLIKPSFRSISPKGKAGTIRRIYKTCETSERVGSRLMNDIERKFSTLINVQPLESWEKDENDNSLSREELSSRLKKLCLDLDRINRSEHTRTPL